MRKYSSPSKHTNKEGHMLMLFVNSEGKEQATVRCKKCSDKPLDPKLPPHKTVLNQVIPLTITNAKMYLRPLQLEYLCSYCKDPIMVR